MQSTQRILMNIKSPALRPKEIAMAIDHLDNAIGLARLKDEKTKLYIPLKPFFAALKFFNMEGVPQAVLDADGYESLRGMDPDLLYHTDLSLRKQGLVEVPKDSYPSPYGGSLYHDQSLWNLTRDVINVEGRNIEHIQIAQWEILSNSFDMSDHHWQPRGEEKNHFLGRMTSMQRLFIDAQNLLGHAKDKTKKKVHAATEQWLSSLDDWVGLHKELIGTVRAMEMAHGKKEGSEEVDTVRAMIQYQLRMENTRPYTNQAHRYAINDCLVELRKEGDNNPDLMRIQRVTDIAIMRWRSVGVTDVVDQASAETESRSVERVMVAAAKQILEDRAKEVKEKELIRPHDPRAKSADKEKWEVIELRRELADLRNQMNQQRGNGGKYQDRPYQSGAKWGGRGRQGGYDRRPILNGGPHRGGMSREARLQMQSSPRESGFYVRLVGFDPDADVGEKAACRIARVKTVKMDQIFDGDSGVHCSVQYDHFELKGTKKLEEEKMEKKENPVEEGIKTRGQLARKAMEKKRKLEELNSSEGNQMQLADNAEGQLENNAKKQKMDQEEQTGAKEVEKLEECKIVTFGPKKPDDQMLSAWAWGTGSAEEFEGHKRYEAWEDH
jgi:hypothetical protein